MAFVEDRALFLSTDDFAVTATVGAASVAGIFDRQYAEPLGNFVEGSSPVFLVNADDLPDVAQGDLLTIDGTDYKVRGVEPDGTGFILLRLEVQ